MNVPFMTHGHGIATIYPLGRRKRMYLFWVFFEIIFDIIVSLTISIVEAFFRNIIVFDCVLGAGFGGLVLYGLEVHSALCLVAAILIFLILLGLQTWKIGVWIVGGAMCIFWSLVFSNLAMDLSENDLIWGTVIFNLSFIGMVMLHI